MNDARHVVCPLCGSVNRLPAGRPAEAAKCGTCREKLFAGHPHDIAGPLLDKIVARDATPVLVDVWAPWCGPCRMMAPAFDAAARELEPEVRLVKLNSDAEQAVAGRLGIRGIPTLILFAKGREIARSSGAMTASQIVAWTRGRLPAA